MKMNELSLSYSKIQLMYAIKGDFKRTILSNIHFLRLQAE